MDIASQTYVICCVLPLIASIALSIQIYLHSLKNNSKRTSFHLPDDDFLYSMQGLITIIQQDSRITYNHHQYTNNQHKELHDSHQKPSSQDTEIVTKWKRQSSNKSLLQGCSAGLAKMKLINEAFLNDKKGYFSGRLKQQKLKRTKKSCKQDFEPTYLPIIVQGLQY